MNTGATEKRAKVRNSAMTTPRKKGRRRSFGRKIQSPSYDIQCVPQLINGVQCMSFTSTPEANTSKCGRNTRERTPKRVKRNLRFQNKHKSNIHKNVMKTSEANSRRSVEMLRGGMSSPHMETACERAERISNGLQWTVVRVLGKASEGKEIVLVRPMGISWSPLISALKDKDGSLTILWDSNKQALFQIEDGLNLMATYLARRERQVVRACKNDMKFDGHLKPRENESFSDEFMSGVDNVDGSTDASNYPSHYASPGMTDGRFPRDDTINEIDEWDHFVPRSEGSYIEPEMDPLSVRGFPKSAPLTEDFTESYGSADDTDEGENGIEVINAAINLLGDFNVDVDLQLNRSMDPIEASNSIGELIKILKFGEEPVAKETRNHVKTGDELIENTNLDQTLERLRESIEGIKRSFNNKREAVHEITSSKEGGIQNQQKMEDDSVPLIFETEMSGYEYEYETSPKLSGLDYQKYATNVEMKPDNLVKYDQVIYNLIDE